MVEASSVHRKVVGLILGQGTDLGGGFNPQLGNLGVCGRQLMDVSLSHQYSLSVSPPPSLKSINAYLGEDLKTKTLLATPVREGSWKPALGAAGNVVKRGPHCLKASLASAVSPA